MFGEFEHKSIFATPAKQEICIRETRKWEIAKAISHNLPALCYFYERGLDYSVEIRLTIKGEDGVPRTETIAEFPDSYFEGFFGTDKEHPFASIK